VILGCIACRWSVVEGHSPWQGAFDQTLIQKFDATDTMISGLWTVAMLVSCCVTPFNGHVLDRCGARLTLLMYAPVFLGGLALLANAESLATVAVGYALMRIGGPEQIDQLAKVTLQRWFIKHRGKAMAAFAASDVVFMNAPVLASAMLTSWGQTKTMMYWVGISTGFLLLALFVVLDYPEKYGLLPDGKEALGEEEGEGEEESVETALLTAAAATPCALDQEDKSDQPRGAATGEMLDPGCFTAEEAIATPCFWAIVFTNLASSTFTTGLQFHAAALVVSGGHPGLEIAYVFTTMSIVRASWGVLVQGLLVDQTSDLKGLAGMGPLSINYYHIWTYNPRFYSLYRPRWNGDRDCLHGSLCRRHRAASAGFGRSLASLGCSPWDVDRDDVGVRCSDGFHLWEETPG